VRSHAMLPYQNPRSREKRMAEGVSLFVSLKQ
jgi:hypothetical protein